MYAIENKDKYDLNTLAADLERRYGPAVAQNVVDHLQRNIRSGKAPEYMDVKALSELQERYRAQAMMAVWRLREWRKSQRPVEFSANLVELEGAFLARQCQDAVSLYRQATSMYFSMHRRAMAAYAKPERSAASGQEVCA